MGSRVDRHPARGAWLLALALLAPATGVKALAEEPATTPAASPSAFAESFPKASPALERRLASLLDRLRRTVAERERSEIVGEIADLGTPAIPLFLTELERHSELTWPVMIYALGATGDPRVIPELERQLTHQRGRPYLDVLYALSLAGEPSALVRAMRSTHADSAFERNMTVIDFIAGARGPEAVDVLMREIPRRSEKARFAALRALGTICDARAVDFLLGWSRRENAGDRRFALIALARIGDQRATPRLLEALADPDPAVQEAAAEGLGYLRASEAGEQLAKLTRADVPLPIRVKAIWSLGLIGGNVAREALLGAFKTAGPVDGPLLIKALGRLADPAAAPLLTGLALGSDPRSREAAEALSQIEGAEATDALLRVCGEAPRLEAGLVAARALAQRRDPRAIPCTVERLRREIDERHRLSPVAEEILAELSLSGHVGAADSLESLSASVAAPALAHRLRVAAQGIRLVRERGDEIESWLYLLENGTPDEVAFAVRRLGDLGDPRAVAPLGRLFGRFEPEISSLIPEALARIGSDRATPVLISLLTDELYRVPSLRPARDAAARALVRCRDREHVARALKSAFVAEKGAFFTPLMALARVGGEEAIPDLLELKSMLLRRRDSRQVLRHEKVNWALRMLRAGREIPLEEIGEAY